MDTILGDLMDQSGIYAAMVFDGSGQIHGHRGHSVFDRELLGEASSVVGKALDTIELLHDDWEAMQAQFSDGLLLLRNLGRPAGTPGRWVLAVIADSSLNQSFATVVMRVVVQKLKRMLATPNAISSLSAASHPAASSSLPPPLPRPVGRVGAPTVSDLGIPDPGGRSGLSATQSGLSWSGSKSSLSSSGMSVLVADEEGMAFLSQLSRALAPFVGPMARVFVKDAVRELCRDRPFSLDRAGDLTRVVEGSIEDVNDRQAFRNAAESLLGGTS